MMTMGCNCHSLLTAGRGAASGTEGVAHCFLLSSGLPWCHCTHHRDAPRARTHTWASWTSSTCSWTPWPATSCCLPSWPSHPPRPRQTSRCNSSRRSRGKGRARGRGAAAAAAAAWGRQRGGRRWRCLRRGRSCWCACARSSATTARTRASRCSRPTPAASTPRWARTVVFFLSFLLRCPRSLSPA